MTRTLVASARTDLPYLIAARRVELGRVENYTRHSLDMSCTPRERSRYRRVAAQRARRLESISDQILGLLS